MNHLIVSREFPPSSYSQGGIGTYAAHIAKLLAERGETVHVIGEQWAGARQAREVQCNGFLVVHRVPLDRALPGHDTPQERQVLKGLLASDCPVQAFSWQVARCAERLVEEEGIDCIEGQDYEAPLYYFLSRRALGLGPARQPATFVHLHSPTQVICHHNEWDIGRSDHLTIKRLEDFVILASDAALCPSHYLARQAERHYGLPPHSVDRIALPHGDTPFLERDASVWKSGTICYFGRMEPRKGVFEWIEAAVTVSRERPDVRFELIGADTSPSNAWPASVRAALEARVPSDLRSRFGFFDAVPRAELRSRLARARIAVVPSRWENYPNTCVEAMSTGLPVLATREGGMLEMIEDGRTGWLSTGTTADALAAGLRRALEVPPDVVARMGGDAAIEVRRLCDNAVTVERHVQFRRRVAAAGPERSLNPDYRGSSTILFGSRTVQRPTRATDDSSRRGIGVIVELGPRDRVEDIVADLTAQSEPPAVVIVDTQELQPEKARAAVQELAAAGLPVVPYDTHQGSWGFPRALERLRTTAAVAVRARGCRLDAEFLKASLSTVARCPSVGVVSHWQRGEGAVGDTVRPNPARPYQWLIDDVGRSAAFRSAAIEATAWLVGLPGGRPSVGDVALAIFMEGWDGVTYPEFLSRQTEDIDIQRKSLERSSGVRLRQFLLTRSDASGLADAAEAMAIVLGQLAPLHHARTAGAILRLPWADRWRIARTALRSPRRILAWASGRRR